MQNAVPSLRERFAHAMPGCAGMCPAAGSESVVIDCLPKDVCVLLKHADRTCNTPEGPGHGRRAHARRGICMSNLRPLTNPAGRADLGAGSGRVQRYPDLIEVPRSLNAVVRDGWTRYTDLRTARWRSDHATHTVQLAGCELSGMECSGRVQRYSDLFEVSESLNAVVWDRWTRYIDLSTARLRSDTPRGGRPICSSLLSRVPRGAT